MAKLLPSFDLMKTYYLTDPDPQKIKKEIGKDVDQPHYHNTCVIRLSHSFNYANHLIPSDTAVFRTKQGADGKWYGLRVSEFRKYMERTYGKPTLLVVPARKGDGVSPARFKGLRGIMGLAVDGFSDATGHFTLWEIDRMLYGHMEYFKRAHEVALWSPDDPNTRWSEAPV